MSSTDDIHPWLAWPIGTRVVVRRWLSSEEQHRTGYQVTDHTGVMSHATTAAITLHGDGHHADRTAPITISAEQIVAIKQIPPRPERRSPRRSV